MSTRPSRSNGRLILATLLGVVVACASPSRPRVEAAATSLQGARAEGVDVRAPIAYREAEQTLERANTALDRGDDAEARHLAELTEERVLVARSVAEEKQLRVESEALVDRATDQALASRAEAAVAAERRAESERSRADALLSGLQSLQAREEPRGLVLTLGDLLFDVDGATLAPGAAPHLERLAQFLRENPDRSVLIEGHTDDTGTPGHDADLSERRAEAVRDRLESLGVERSRMRVVARVASGPYASSATAAGRQEARSVEVVIRPAP
ncbi:MAG TPA: OmpA family protein [Myxococcota bacterium]|jgi:outer membrane protein OmpA-like peptidoglycan-associated protein|nr:OmpA family protein [Myxococcota bacterium]